MQQIPVSCNKDCGGGCGLLAHVDSTGCIVKISDNPLQPRFMQGCIRGYQMHKTLYAADRLKTPLVRTGPRGSGQFRTASWNEALDLAADRLQALRDRFGSTALLGLPASGACRGLVHNTHTLARRFFSLWGPITGTYGSYSSNAAGFVTTPTFGTPHVGLDPSTLRHSKMIVLWGANIAVTRFGSDLENRLKACRQAGIPIVVIDPRRSRTVRKLDAEWIALFPGSDAAFMAAVLYVLLENRLVDRNFLERYVHGFSQLEAYITGQTDDVPKTPVWAEMICGTPAATIRDFALRYGSTKPVALIPGLSIQRAIGGEDNYRLAFALQAATGNTGRPGGSSGGNIWGSLPHAKFPSLLTLPPGADEPAIPVYEWADVILSRPSAVAAESRYPTTIRGVYIVGNNLLNQGSDIRKNMRAFESLEVAICHDLFMTPTARYCDIILPVTTSLEREDIMSGAGNYFFYSHKAIEPVHQCRNDFDIFSSLARRLGLEPAFSDNRSAGQWLERILASSAVEDPQAFRRTGIFLGQERDRVGLSDFIRDPEGHPLRTESGKIEICAPACQLPDGPPHPTCRGEHPSAVYPLSMVTPHSRVRINSTNANLAWARKMAPARLWIHPIDAANRGLKAEDKVLVQSSTGFTRVALHVTEDIIEGVVCLHQGQWVELDSAGCDTAGAANTLTSTRPTMPSHGARTHTVFVEVIPV